MSGSSLVARIGLLSQVRRAGRFSSTFELLDGAALHVCLEGACELTEAGSSIALRAGDVVAVHPKRSANSASPPTRRARVACVAGSTRAVHLVTWSLRHSTPVAGALASPIPVFVQLSGETLKTDPVIAGLVQLITAEASIQQAENLVLHDLMAALFAAVMRASQPASNTAPLTQNVLANRTRACSQKVEAADDDAMQERMSARSRQPLTRADHDSPRAMPDKAGPFATATSPGPFAGPEASGLAAANHLVPLTQSKRVAPLTHPVPMPHAAIRRVLLAMSEAPEQRWTLESLAKMARLSRSAFSRQFTEVVGEPPLRHLTRWRMELASELLVTTDESLAEIAGRVGYESEFAFSRAFKRHAGEAPGTFRRRIQSRSMVVLARAA